MLITNIKIPVFNFVCAQRRLKSLVASYHFTRISQQPYMPPVIHGYKNYPSSHAHSGITICRKHPSVKQQSYSRVAPLVAIVRLIQVTLHSVLSVPFYPLSIFHLKKISNQVHSMYKCVGLTIPVFVN